MEKIIMQKHLSGIFAPITTPFSSVEDVDFNNLEANIHKYNVTPLSGFYVLGSNGENKSLSDHEKILIVKAVVRERESHKLVIVGTSAESTILTLKLTNQAAEAGADFALILPPSYFKKNMTDEVLLHFFTDIANDSPIPILIYNAPGFTGISVSLNLVKELSKHPNIVGIKDSSPGLILDYLSLKNNGFAVLSGTINTLLPAILLGASGGIVSLANIFPQICTDLYQLIMDGKMEEARKLQFSLFHLSRSISGAYGVAGVKYSMELAGYFGGNPRKPLLPLTESDKERVRSIISEMGYGQIGSNSMSH
jgi:4-hydroxy-2-oxoglutarate aldolase